MKTFVINTVGQTNQLGIFDGGKNIAEYLSDGSTKRSGSESLFEKSQELLKKADRRKPGVLPWWIEH